MQVSKQTNKQPSKLTFIRNCLEICLDSVNSGKNLEMSGSFIASVTKCLAESSCNFGTLMILTSWVLKI